MAISLLTCWSKVEISFSIMNNFITSGTSRLIITTLNALQTVEYHLLAEGKSSVDYFYKSYFLLEPVDRSLVDNIRSSSKAYEKEKSEKVMVVKNEIKDLKEKILSEEKAKKKMCYKCCQTAENDTPKS
ncbi:hypothetical protein AVEN_208937-1 [Araneus ventricosus]|uniref:Uncharacterized protein n=1 Tax=Araneus ventricosus TaxID=182803 RepID=A0A4Y2HPA7_ARAVE|nr:hypothetical protein AVEN_208937-1 [Araneus ventricosus]